MTLGRDVDIVSAYGCLERGTNRERKQERVIGNGRNRERERERYKQKIERGYKQRQRERGLRREIEKDRGV